MEMDVISVDDSCGLMAAPRRVLVSSSSRFWLPSSVCGKKPSTQPIVCGEAARPLLYNMRAERASCGGGRLGELGRRGDGKGLFTGQTKSRQVQRVVPCIASGPVSLVHH